MNLKKILYSNLQTMTLESYQKYLNEEELGYIKINRHPEDENIVILNYTETTAFERRWNNETMTARGLILDLTEAKNNGIIYILARPFDKFFNYGENLEYEKDIDFTKIVSVMEKMDGSLGISYFFNDELRFATRGSFTSEQAIKATEIWRNKYSMGLHRQAYVSNPSTLLVEIIYPENRVVVDYKSMEDLVLLGVNEISKHAHDSEWSIKVLKSFAKSANMPIAKQYDFTLEKMLEMKKSISANEEGWILKFANGKRLKIKGDEYLGVHRILHGLSDKAKFKAWSEGKLEEYIKMLPEEFRPELEEFGEILDKLENLHYQLLSLIFKFAIDKYPQKKDFAIHVTSTINPEYRPFLFKAHKYGNISKEMIRERIYKEYKKYIEVIDEWKNNVSS